MMPSKSVRHVGVKRIVVFDAEMQILILVLVGMIPPPDFSM